MKPFTRLMMLFVLAASTYASNEPQAVDVMGLMGRPRIHVAHVLNSHLEMLSKAHVTYTMPGFVRFAVSFHNDVAYAIQAEVERRMEPLQCFALLRLRASQWRPIDQNPEGKPNAFAYGPYRLRVAWSPRTVKTYIRFWRSYSPNPKSL